jgi:hypothetical protein
LGLEQLLPHGGNEVRASGDNADAMGWRIVLHGQVARGHTIAAVLCQERNRFLYRARTEQFELWETQSSPPA